MWENIEKPNLQQQKKEEIIWCQNQTIILQSFSQKMLAIKIKNEENSNT